MLWRSCQRNCDYDHDEERRVAARPTSGIAVLACLLLLPASTLTAEDLAWHLPEWGRRVVVAIAEPDAAGPSVDTAGVKVLCQGQVQADGRDYRVLDAAGNAVPFQLVYHDPHRYSLISFRVSDPNRQYLIYFGNRQADAAPELVPTVPTPGAGPPEGAWIPRHGLVFATVARPEGNNPETLEDMARLMQRSPGSFGARYQRRIADGYNPFGPSDLYISLYRGWIDLPAAGQYAFCTASNEASFSFIDGRELVHWPGRHTTERGARGEKNATVELAAGPHYIEYYHEEVYLQQMAYLGWRPPDVEGSGFSPVPDAVFATPHAAEAVRYETRAESGAPRPLVRFEPVIADSVWPIERREGQYTRCLFELTHPPEGAAIEWDFGDGQKAAGPSVEHVYLTTDLYAVTLTVTGPQGAHTVRWPLLVYELQHVTEHLAEGVASEYTALARTYDRSNLNAAQLKELAHLFAENDALEEAVAAGKEFVARFQASDPQWAPQVRRLIAGCALRQGEAGGGLADKAVDEAIANYQAAADAEPEPSLKLDALAQLIRLVGIERGLADKAEALLVQAEATTRGAGLEHDNIAAYRRVLMAAGDVRLWHDHRDRALVLYRKAEALDPDPIPSQVRAARIGAYPNAIRAYLAGENYAAALHIIDRWEESFPTGRAGGQTFFWRGKTLALSGRHAKAARYLALCVKLAIGAHFETEARWRLAQSLEKLGQLDDARRELAKLVATGMNDPFTDLARESLAAVAQEGGADE